MPTKTSEALVLTSKQNGIVVIPMGTELTRLNYFDGKFLRASDLKAEQDYLRHLVQESNRAGGSGVAHGFDVTRGDGDTLNIGPGLAIDVEGRVLLMPQAVNIGIQDLINKSLDAEKLFGDSAKGANFAECEIKSETPPDKTTHANDIYKIVICAAEALCGEEDVYGKLCEEACATSTDRPLIIEGVMIRAVKLEVSPTTKGELTQTTLRSRTAAAYFEHERGRISSLISGEGLKSQTWCRGATADTDGCVPIAVVARAGKTTVFLDPWIIRRELMDTPARRYWQWRMMMRPWDVFLAQILQFQCQLRDLTGQGGVPGGDIDPCGGAREALLKARDVISGLSKYYGEKPQDLFDMGRRKFGLTGEVRELDELSLHLDTVYKGLGTGVKTNRWLINGGIIELPSAGYLPVVPGAQITINQQVRQMMGEGVDLRFCIVRPDYVAHALEEAQHMERISLIAGLEDAKQKPKVDILVPDGEIIEQKAPSQNLFEATITGMTTSFDTKSLNAATSDGPQLVVEGAARPEALSTGGGAFHLAIGATLSADDFFRSSVKGSAETSGGAAKKDSGQADSAAHPGAQLFAQFARFATAGAQTKGSKTESAKGTQEAATISIDTKNPTISGGIWLTMRCERDVFKMAVNETTTVSANGVLGITFQEKTVFIDATLVGQFKVTSAATGNQGTVLGAFIGTASASMRIPDEAPKDVNKAVTVKLAIEAGQSSKPQGRLIRIIPELPNERLSVELTVDLGGNPLEVNCEVNVQPVGGFKRTVLTADFRSNEAVAQVTNKFHGEATDALELIEDVSDEAGFAAKSGKILFPPAPPAGDELIIKGVTDWVLFHRRRNQECQGVVIPPPPPPPPDVKSVCHSVYQADSDRDYEAARSQIDSVIEAKQGKIENALKEFGLVHLGDVLFEEGTDKVFGNGKSLDQVVGKWTGPKNVSRCNAYFAPAGKQAAPQGSKITQTIGSSIFIKSAEVPTGVVMPTNCPVFSIMVAKEAAPAVAHTIYIAPTQDQFQKAVNEIKGMTGGDIDKQIIGLNQITKLGDVQFEEHTATVFGDGKSMADVATAWKKITGAPVSQVATFHALAQKNETSHGNQGKEVANKITGSAIPAGNASVSEVSASAKMPTAAPAFSIMVPGQTTPKVCHSVYRTTDSASFANAQGQLLKFTGGDIQKLVISANNLQLIGAVEFEEDTATVVGNSMKDFLKQWPTTGQATLGVMACNQPQTSAQDTSRKNQAVAIQKGIDAQAAFPITPAFLPSAVKLPTACAAFTIILVQNQGVGGRN